VNDPLHLALTIGLSRGGSFEPPALLAEHLQGRGPAAALRAVAAMACLEAGARVPDSLPALDPAPAETQATLRPSAVSLLIIVCVSETWLLDEALAVLAERGMRVPHAVLAMLLGSAETKMRRRVAAVAGERGRWLGLHVKAHAWLRQAPRSADAAVLRRVFAEGSTLEREGALKGWRALDATAAREALSLDFSKDPADVRLRLLACLRVGLAPDDEPFLASVISDRAATVQAEARRLALKLPSSAISERMRLRLAQLLKFKRAELELDLSAPWLPDWASDGLLEPPQNHASPRSFRARQLACLTQPRDWLRLSALEPAEFAQTLCASVWFSELMSGWAEAGAALGALAEPLVEQLCAEFAAKHSARRDYQRIEAAKFAISQLDAASWARQLSALLHSEGLSEHAIALLPRPWPREATRIWAAQLRKRLSDVPIPKAGEPNPANTFYPAQARIGYELDQARQGIDPSHIEPALDTLNVVAEHPLVDRIESFQRALQLRLRIHMEFYS